MAERWTNWSGELSCEPAVVERPRSIEEVVAAVARAREAGRRIRVAGSGHSFTAVALSDGTLMEIGALDRVLAVERDRMRVTVEAGITIRRLNEELATAGLALANLGDIDAQTIAGAISTATHGTGLTKPSLSAQVRALKLVCADGEVRTFDEASDPDGWRAARVAVGALGVIVEVTLDVVEAFVLRRVDEPVALDEALATLDERVEGNDHFEFFVFPYARHVLARTTNREDGPARPPGPAKAWTQDILMGNHMLGAFLTAGKAVPKAIPAINRAVTRVAGSAVRIDASHRCFASPRRVRFTEMEYGVPRAAAADMVRGVLGLIERERLPISFPIELRFVAPDDALLGTAHGRESAYIAVHTYRGMFIERYFREVEALADAHEGRPHWGKRHFQTAATLAARYPRWDDFQAVRARLDPDGRFGNAHTDAVLGQPRAGAS